MDEFRNWIWYRKFTGGLFCTFVSQQLDVCEWFLNAVPRAVTASGGCDAYEGRENYDTVLAVYEFPGEEGTIRAACHLFAASSAGGTRQYERFLGSDASVQISQNPRWTQICREPHVDEWDTWVRKQYLVKPDIPKSYSTEGSNAAGAATVVHVSGEVALYPLPELPTAVPYQPHLKNFFAAVRGRQPLHCPADVAFRSQVMALKGLEAVRAKSTLSFEAAEFEV
jgi:predicted dehydrogenase